MTLFKNEPVPGNDGLATTVALLPLAGTEKVAMIGPQANFTLEMLSNYEGSNTLALGHSPLMAARAAGLDVTWTPGHSMNVADGGRAQIPAAVAAARAADVAIVMVGLCADHCSGGKGVEDEGFDRLCSPGGHCLGLPGAQEPLLEAVLAAQPKTVLVMINGGMISIAWASAHVPAILGAWCGNFDIILDPFFAYY